MRHTTQFIGGGKRRPGHGRTALLNLAIILLPLVLFSGCVSTNEATESFFDQQALPPMIADGAPAVDSYLLEQAIATRINAIRMAHGLGLLNTSDDLAEVAVAHSRDMATHGFFGHTSLRGESPDARAEKAGLGRPQQVGQQILEGVSENLFATHLFAEYTIMNRGSGAITYDVVWKTTADLARETVEAWMQSPSHRDNLLSPLFNTQALGIVLGANQTIFVTQNLMHVPPTRWASKR